MGWLFAVGRGLQQRDRRAVWRALGPLALGHAARDRRGCPACHHARADAADALAAMVVAAALVAVGVDGLVHHRHFRLGGMRVNARSSPRGPF